jgi:hypothetical protein
VVLFFEAFNILRLHEMFQKNGILSPRSNAHLFLMLFNFLNYDHELIKIDGDITGTKHV